jgi:inner membrane transporter RhtA
MHVRAGHGRPSAASPAGVALALGAAAGVAASTLAGERVARSTGGLDGVALGAGAAALMTLPVGLPAAAGAVEPGALAVAAAVGVLGIAVPYALFFVALRRVGARTYSVLLSLDPAVALVAGLLLLGQAPAAGALAGVALVVAASVLAVGTQRR